MYVNTNNIEMAKIAVNKSLLKEYSTNSSPRTVYLRDGDEYQIQLYNPTDDDIAATIYIDNKKLSRQLVIRPGERIWLERYLDVSKKFKFSTYEVEDNVETEKAISNNGEIRVQFFKADHTAKSITVLGGESYPSISIDNSILKCSDYVPDVCFNASDISNSFVSTGATICTNNASLSGAPKITACCNSAVGADTPKTLSFSAAQPTTAKVETGRTGAGSYSSQKFEDVCESFNNWAFKTETIKILPISCKPVTSEDIEKLYCTECGRKLKTKYKFCPYCGTKID